MNVSADHTTRRGVTGIACKIASLAAPRNSGRCTKRAGRIVKLYIGWTGVGGHARRFLQPGSLARSWRAVHIAESRRSACEWPRSRRSGCPRWTRVASALRVHQLRVGVPVAASCRGTSTVRRLAQSSKRTLRSLKVSRFWSMKPCTAADDVEQLHSTVLGV